MDSSRPRRVFYRLGGVELKRFGLFGLVKFSVFCFFFFNGLFLKMLLGSIWDYFLDLFGSLFRSLFSNLREISSFLNLKNHRILSAGLDFFHTT